MEENGQQIPKRLYKSRRNKIIDGVCGGFAEYFDVDASIIRLIWVLITLMGGSGLIAYLIAMIIMPANPEHLKSPETVNGSKNGSSDRRRFFGIMLILIGALILLANIGWFWDFGWWSFSWKILLPVLVIGLGIFLIYTQESRKIISKENIENQSGGEMDTKKTKELRRSRVDRKLFGICAGLAKYFEIDVTLIRVIFVFFALLSFGWVLLIYIILGIVMPEEKISTTSS